MWELDYKESWAPNNWYFSAVVLQKTLESPLDCKEIQPVHPKGNQSWIFNGRPDAEAETPILWPPDELTHWKRLWFWERLKAGGEGDNRGWDVWMTSPVRWTRVWASSGSWWWTGKPGMLRSMGSQSDMTEWLNWTECLSFTDYKSFRVGAGHSVSLSPLHRVLSIWRVSAHVCSVKEWPDHRKGVRRLLGCSFTDWGAPSKWLRVEVLLHSLLWFSWIHREQLPPLTERELPPLKASILGPFSGTRWAKGSGWVPLRILVFGFVFDSVKWKCCLLSSFQTFDQFSNSFPCKLPFTCHFPLQFYVRYLLLTFCPYKPTEHILLHWSTGRRCCLEIELNYFCGEGVAWWELTPFTGLPPVSFYF